MNSASREPAWPGDVVNLVGKFALFDERWSPRVVGCLNGQLVKLAKIQGEFVWHAHPDEDELFFVIRGALTLRLREQQGEREIIIRAGEFFIVPRGVEHLPAAAAECWVMLFEPAHTAHTGATPSARAVAADDQPRI